MNRHFLSYILIPFIFLCSCSKENIGMQPGSESEHIMFSTPEVLLGSEAETRSMLKGSSLPAGSSFSVWGYCRAYAPGTTNLDDNSSTSEWDIKKALCPPTLFTPNKLEVTVNANGCSYYDTQSGGTKAWLVGDDNIYSFAAMYPYEANGLNVSFKQQNGKYVDAPIITYTMPYSGDVTADTYKNTPDVMVGFRKNHRKIDGHVPFTFHHLMSALSVRVNNYSEYYDADNNLQGTELEIHSIKLQGTFHKTIQVDLSTGGDYTFSDSYTATYVLYEDGGAGYSVPYIDDPETPEVDETSVVLGEPVMLLCGKPGIDDPYGPGSKNQDTGIKLVLDYTFGGVRKTDVKFNLINPDLSFSPQVGVNYTFQLNWIGDGLVLLIMPSSNAQWGDGEGDDSNAGNDDIIFE